MPDNPVDEMEAKLLAKAIRKRDLLARSIQRMCTQIENMDVDENEPKTALEAAKIDKADLEKKLSEFHEIQSTVEMDIEDEELAKHEDERSRIESLARSAKVILADFITTYSDPAPGEGSVRRSTGIEFRAERKIRRPEIQIPTFEGDYRKWSDFKNVFESLVVNDTAYTEIEKMVYLKQAVQKNAAEVIRKFELTEKNFEKAWTKLKKRYENRRATINTHLQALTQLPPAKTEAGLQKLLDAASDAIESLDAMGVRDGWSYMVSYLVADRLDPETRKAWEIATVKEQEYPKYETLEAFLHERVRVVESMGNTGSTQRNSGSTFTARRTESARTLVATTANPGPTAPTRRCFDCQENHGIAECEKFLARPLTEKTELIKRRGLCFQCLCKGHMVLSCRAPRCSKCSKRHHILLHIETEKPASGNAKAVNESNTETGKVLLACAEKSNVFLPTALVNVCCFENKILARVFLDSCSEINLISESLVRKLKCSTRHSNVIIKSAIPGSFSTTKVCKVKIESRSGEFCIETWFQVTPFVADEFTVYDASVYGSKVKKLADDPRLGGARVDLLLGAGYFEEVMLPGRYKLTGEPYLRETKFGWVAIGSARSRVAGDTSKCYLAIQDQLQKFFVLEEVGSAPLSWTPEEAKCDEHFESTFGRSQDSKFVLELPKGLSVEFLGESRSIAFKQLCSLERRLSIEAFDTYKGFMDEYIRLGHMTLIEKPDPLEFRCFLPHHAVWKRTSTTTRMRAVFNASCPTASGCSLNDVLMKGPALQEDLFSIVVRFRTKRVAFTADIEKMYRQVWVKKEDRCLQCVLWRDRPTEVVRTYELNTVTYGTKPASYLATKCLSKLADEYDSELPETAAILRRDFYMDDVLTGGSSVDDVRARLQELRQILGSAGFPLRKFASNSLSVLAGLDSDCIEGALEFERGEQAVGLLGMRWLTAEDRLAFYARFPEQPVSWTKREILSEVSRIFDPLGLVSPVTITLKILLQSLWSSQLGWDDLITGEVVVRYTEIRKKLTVLPSLIIHRFVGEVEQAEFHVFCDASERAYGAAVYVRRREGSQVVLRLLCAKTRVAPVKKVSLPRLELCGAVLAASLFGKVKAALNLNEKCQVVAWTDSTIVLSWLAKPGHSWCTFVANRVTKVLELIPTGVWNHVRSQDNAADIISRGIDAKHFRELENFICGPTFLRQQSLHFSELEFDIEALREEKKQTRVLLATVNRFVIDIIEQVSGYSKLIRVISYVYRFASNCVLEKDSRTFVNLTLAEFSQARLVVIRAVQTSIDNRKLSRIDYFIDSNNVIRLRSRLSNAEISERVKYPIVLPKCRFLNLLIEEYHVKFFHANCLFLRNFINFEYFVLANLNRIVRSVVYKCVTCRRFLSGLEFKIPVGQLPAPRVNASPAFVEVGIDFAGPFSTRAMGPSGNRGKVIFKSYVAVFVCMVTKACHLEIVEDLSTKCFLDAFSRFVARRGMCANVYSDNGTNFVGADRELKVAFELVFKAQSEIERYAVSQGIGWHFIPQRAPNFGGLWEAAVKSFKSHFRKVVGCQILSFVELVTLATQIEAVLNSRPICSSDSVGDCFVTPSHLCIGRALMLVPELPGEVVNGTHLVRYKLIRGMFERFWSVWRSEYLVALRKATVSVKENRIPRVGELVLVKDEATAPIAWPLARIVKLFFGKDEVARVADVRLGAKVLRRPIIKLVPLLPETAQSHGGGGC